MKPTKTLLQMEAAECGAVALGIILAWFGRHESLASLRRACGVSRDGAKAAHILSAARSFGLTASAFRCEPDQLRGWKGPFIVHWQFNHFVVVEGFSRNKVFLNDPACGRRMVPASEFDTSFTGIALVFDQGSDFQKTGRPYQVWQGLRQRLRGHAGGILMVFLATLALVPPALLAIFLPKIFVDNLLLEGQGEWKANMLLAMAAAAAALFALTFEQQRTLLGVENRLAVEGSRQFLWRVLQLPMEFFRHRHAGEIGYRVNANDRLAGLIAGELAPSLVHGLAAAICACAMLIYDVRLTILSLAITLLNLGILRFTQRRRSELGLRLTQERGRLVGFVAGGLLAMESVKALGGEAAFFERWAGRHARAANADQDLQAASQVWGVVPGLLGGINVALVLSFGASRMMDGLLSGGALLAFLAILQSFQLPVSRLMRLGARLHETAGDLQRLDDVLEYPVDPLASQIGTPEPQRLMGHFELRNVTFGYSRLERPLIENLSLTIPAGHSFAFAGCSGSGKSTIARLLCGLDQPWSGEILFDGVPLNVLGRYALANSIALVDQDIFLFEGSIAENIALWDSTLTEEAIVQAARDALIHEDIVTKLGGYGARLDELGRNLSGGQRQRIEIARALAVDPKILVLDEATSALDPFTERRLAGNLKRRGCTCIIIAHRLSTIQDCDKIAVLENGRIVEQGAHADLVRQGGTYARLLAEQ